MRLFIGTTFDRVFLEGLTDIQEQLRSADIKGNYVPTENLHLTLAFIGDYNHPDTVLDALEDITRPSSLMNTAAGGGMSVEMSGVEYWRDLFAVRLTANQALNGYVRKLHRCLSDYGIPYDRKKFKPHVTILRQAEYRVLPEITVPQKSAVITRISLFRSDRGKHGMIYTEIGGVEG